MTESIHIAECMRRDIGLGLNNLIAKGLYECAIDAPSRATATEQSASQPAAVDDPKYRIWPSSHRNHSVGTISEYDRIAALMAVRSNSATGFRSEKVSKMMFPDPPKPKSTQPIAKRRKAPVQDLVTQAAIADGCMDSPTLPRHPPARPAPRPSMRDRSSSEPCDARQQAPKHTAPSQHTVTATAKETIKIKIKADLATLPATVYSAKPTNDDAQPPSYERVQRESGITSFLSPLVIPEFGFDGEFGLLNPTIFEKEKEIPPPVPPKSPKMARSTSPTKIAINHSNGSSATLVNTSRSNSPNTPQEAQKSPRTWERSRKRIDENPRPISITSRSKPRRAPSGYRQRDRQGTVQLSKSIRIPERKETCFMREPKYDQPSPAGSLSHADLSALSQELHELEDKCEHLRKTHNSLRTSRRTLRSRMITYLKSPRVSAFSRKNILRREESLAELEVSIDDIVHKLEQAEGKRTLIRQRLVQHVAATLQQRNESAPSSFMTRQTPPHSPSSTQRGGLRKQLGRIDSIESNYNTTIESLVSDIETMMLGPHPALA